MKLTALLIFGFLMQVSATGISQTVTLSENNVPLRKVFKEIQKQTGFDFLYTYNVIQNAGKVSVNVKGATLKETLDEVLQSKNLEYKILEKTVVVKERQEANSLVVQQGIAQLGLADPVKGIVKDAGGKPLANVSVLLKGHTRGTMTNENGEYILEVADSKNAIIVFSMIGYSEQEIEVKGRSTINVELKVKVSQQEEIVVVGYGSQRKANLTGAVSEIDEKQIENRPVTNMISALQGTMAGVTITAANSGQPGEDAGSIRIRGIGTLNNADPVVVIDGVITTLDNFNNINPNDIATISVLKDAASASIYGSRASNGVLLVTTKLGKKGTFRISYDAYLGKQKPNGLPDFLPSWQAATLYNQALANEGSPLRWTPEEIQKFKDGSDPFNYPNTDWLGLLYKEQGIQQNHYLSFSGGNNKSQYLLSLGLFNEEGLVKKTNANRYTIRYNLKSQVRDNLSVSSNAAFTYSSQERPTNPVTGEFTEVVRLTNLISPTVPYKFKNGQFGYIGNGSPMAWLEGPGGQNIDNYSLLSNVIADWEPVRQLHFRPSVSYMMNILHDKSFVADHQYYDENGNKTFYQGPNTVTVANGFKNTLTFQGLVDYSASFGSHNFKILGGYSQEYNKYTYNDGYRRNFLNNLLSDINLGSTDGQTTSGYSYELALKSYFGRLNYDFSGKYLFEANLRYDGSSRFAKNNRWGLFPSFSAGWNLDKEDFFDNLNSVISSLKLRGSWGKLGNQTISSGLSIDQQYYPAISLVSAGQNYVFGGTSPVIAAGISPVDGSNADIKWESTRETDIGIDAGFLNNRLTLTIDYFNKLTDGILVSIPVGAVFGLNAPVQNAAKMSNKGWEFTFGYNNRIGDFSYNISANASFIKNTVEDLHSTGPVIRSYTYYDEGVPFYSLYGYKAIGIFKSDADVAKAPFQTTTTAAGDLQYADLNGDGKINSEDRMFLGTYFPKTTFGLNMTGKWKGFDLTIFLQGAAGVKNYTDDGKIGMVSDGQGKPTTALLDSWTPNNLNASMPRILNSQGQNSTPSSFWVKDGSYVRLKNLQVGYTLPEKLTKKLGIERIRIYYSGQNILTFDHLYKWVDPESPNYSSIYFYPQVRVSTIGVNVSF
ncbi:MAG: TonB-dependent receptor [Bacteroidetes bacterium]|nr:TonB-dependent receptor [Bacteroidota bacterium]